MEKDGIRTCDACGQTIPPGAKLASKTADGRDLCLSCQIREAQIEKGLRH
jgi:RNA polymerase-binding transcription factor DksA